MNHSDEKNVYSKRRGTSETIALMDYVTHGDATPEEIELSSLYEELGRAYYNVMESLDNIESSDEFLTMIMDRTGKTFAEITALKKQISEKDVKVNADDNIYSTSESAPSAEPKKRCPSCGAENDVDYIFCQDCGSKLDGIAAPAENTNTCPYCGEELMPGSMFCISCGNKV